MSFSIANSNFPFVFLQSNNQNSSTFDASTLPHRFGVGRSENGVRRKFGHRKVNHDLPLVLEITNLLLSVVDQCPVALNANAASPRPPTTFGDPKAVDARGR